MNKVITISREYGAGGHTIGKQVARELGIAMDKLNVHGGGISLGHPVGATGSRIIITLMYELKRRGQRYGLATLCAGGGMGTAVIIENLA